MFQVNKLEGAARGTLFSLTIVVHIHALMCGFMCYHCSVNKHFLRLEPIIATSKTFPPLRSHRRFAGLARERITSSIWRVLFSDKQ